LLVFLSSFAYAFAADSTISFQQTTRYPLMLNLFSPEPSRIIVAQPRRLACQTAARRVAQEQNYFLGKPNCPIGYSIRFETITPSPNCDRTIEFQTPGVLLRYAAEDPLLSDVTHLCIDEIHERNADIDLLLALAKQAVRRRLEHSELPPLRLILMSATLDSSHWEAYFRNENGKAISPELSLKVVNVPEVRRFPIKTVHLCSDSFPLRRQDIDKLIRTRGQHDEDFDDEICKVTAKLAMYLYDQKLDGSILCFLPGMEEIRRVHRSISYFANQRLPPKVVYLHSSISSADQALAFEPGSKIILSTNIAETSVTIPDCKYVIDSGRERQYSLLSKKRASSGSFFEKEPESETSDSVTVVGSQLTTVDISQASAKQRAGRAGRVSAGTCYRLYTKNMYDFELPEFTEPEMLRMDLSQLVLHAISLYHPSTGGHPLSLLSGAPDPPSEANLRRTLRDLVSQGLVEVGEDDFSWSNITSAERNGHNSARAEETKEHRIRLTPLGRAVNEFPVEPVVGRMLLMGLVLQAIDPALTIAALLSVPKVFSPSQDGKEKNPTKSCSDVILQMDYYSQYIQAQGYHPKAIVFDQVKRIRNQLERSMRDFLRRHSHRSLQTGEASEINWNTNSARVVAQAALICCATPHIAHLVNGKEDFATRDVAGAARINHSSVNCGSGRRAYWYVYHELRVVKTPNLYTTTAVSPLELALFTDSDFLLHSTKSSIDREISLFEYMKEAFGDENWLFHADHWVPVVAANPSQRDAILRLRRLLMFEMLQQVAQNPISFAKNTSYQQVILYVLSALEQQRLPPGPENVVNGSSS
jgi:HrpA-like RNA helicase